MDGPWNAARRPAAPAAAPEAPPAPSCPPPLFPVGHYYSPEPTWEDVDRGLRWRGAADPAHGLPGIALDLDAQWAALDAVARARPSALPDPPRFPRGSDQFGVGDAAVYQGVVAWSRPGRILELGIGHSTAAALDAVEALGLGTTVLGVDPEPVRIGPWADADVRAGRLEVRQGLAQDLAPDEVSRLLPGDVLFVDSSHVAKVGSDVLYEVFELLPRLPVGALAHVHDVFPGFEYPAGWLRQGRYWNELYLLRAFLQFNDRFEVLLWPSLLHLVDPGRAAAAVPELGENPGGSLWLRRVRV